MNLTTANPQLADLTALASKTNQAWGTHMKAFQSPGTVMNSVLLVWTPVAGQEIVASDSTVQTGSLGDTDLDVASACFVVNHRTGAYYRGGHSRSYVPGVGKTQVSNGSTINGAAAANFAGAWASFVDAIQTGPAGGITAAQCGTVRFASKGAWMNPPVFVPWQSHAVRPTLGTIRARLTE